MKLSVIIVNYNTKNYLRQALQSIEASRDKIDKETIVVDNASTDGSPAMIDSHFNWVKLIKTPQNLGYAAANNLGLTRAKGEYILFLNSDTQILSDTLTTMVKFMDQHSNVGVSSCRVELINGQIDPASHRGFPTPWAALTYFTGLETAFPKLRLFGQYHQGWQDLSTVHEIDSPAGAFFLTRKKILDQVGGFDDRFFMYAEDLDLSLRIKQAGWKIMYVPTTKIVHYKKKSGRESAHLGTRAKTKDYFFNTMKLFYDKHYRHKYPFFIRWLVLGGIKLCALV
jgi:GT2 family glycosyltransferase